MITTLFVALVVVFSAGLLYVGVHGFRERLKTPEELASSLKPVSIAAFGSLIDPLEDAYLAQRIHGRHLRSVRRERAIIAFEYVFRIAQNSAIVMQAAELAKKSSDPELAGTGARIANMALRTRILAVRTLASIALSVIFPGRPLGAPILHQYSDLDLNICFLRRQSK